MAEYPRTEEGFARALKDADWFVNFHESFREGRKTLWMYVPSINPTIYATSVIEPGLSEIETGTGKINLNDEVADMARLREQING